MEKEFIPYEQSFDLKELGFDELCMAQYNDSNGFDGFGGNYRNSYFNHQDQVAAPLYQQAFRWFREKYKMQAEILWRGDMGCFCYKTGKFKYGEHAFSKDDYKTYEEAELECLKKLIEIVKEK